MVTLIYKKKLTYEELKDELDTYRDTDGVIRNILIRKCDINKIPKKLGSYTALVHDMEVFGLKNSHFIKNNFTTEDYKGNDKPRDTTN